jgi:hypothetical protein
LLKNEKLAALNLFYVPSSGLRKNKCLFFG